MNPWKTAWNRPWHCDKMGERLPFRVPLSRFCNREAGRLNCHGESSVTDGAGGAFMAGKPAEGTVAADVKKCGRFLPYGN